MNARPNILLFWFHDDWGKFGRAYERVAEHLSRMEGVNRVLCIFPPTQQGKYAKSFFEKREISSKLILLTETNWERFPLDRSFSRARSLLNHIFMDWSFKALLRDFGFNRDNTILWLFPPHPYINRLLDIAPHYKVVAHIIDDFTKFDQSHPLYKYASDQYPTLGKWADVIITTSKANHEYFSSAGKPCFMFWPAVDDSFLGAPQPLPFRSSLNNPRLGYVGWMMERTDLELVSYVAEARPNWNIILAGPQFPEDYLAQSGVLDFPNVDYIGTLPQDSVPQFLWSLDVCIMPHRDTEYSRSMGPLKLYQYLASGRPIVATEVAGLERVSEFLHIARNGEEFVQQIEFALNTDNEQLAAKRIECAKANTWSVRVNEMLQVVLKH